MQKNNFENGIGDLRSVVGHQATIADVAYQYEHCTGKLWDRDKCVAKHFSVNRRGKKSEAVDGTHVRMAKIPCERETLCVGDFSALRSTNTKGTMVSQTRKQ